MDTSKAITHLGLCAGYGGIELGLKRVIPSLRSVALCEIESFACANLVSKMEAGLMEPAPIWTDLKTFPWESFCNRVDILTGGYPCQPFSAAGKRLGGGISGISGRTSQEAFPFFDQECASLKTSRATLPVGCITFCATWEDWVIEQRGAYSARLNAAHRTSASESSSWPTARSRDWKDTGDLSKVEYGMTLGRAVQANPSTDGSRQGLWPTARSLDGQVGESLETWEARRQRKAAEGINLHRPLPIAVEQEQRKQWATPRAGCPGSRAPGTGGKVLEEQVKQVKQSGKLNPRWVETLMGLPVGWTMPSCASPVTIELTNSASSETESCQPPQPSPSEPLLLSLETEANHK